jgi:hypothetical protein
MRKILLLSTALIIAAHSNSASADESLQACSKQKIRQMELTHKNSAQRTRGKKQTSATSNRRKIEQIDEWLWKNCRSHAAEMRTIEQQYM